MAITPIASTMSTARPQNKGRHPTTGRAHCTGSVDATMPNDPVISIQELARICMVAANQRR